MDWHEIEEKVRELTIEIFLLQAQCKALLQMDPEYSEYLEAFEERGEGDPLTIRQFHQYSDELDRINDEFNTEDADYETLWVKYRQRIVVLERFLLA